MTQGGPAASGAGLGEGGQERREGRETGVNGQLHFTPFNSDSQVMLRVGGRGGAERVKTAPMFGKKMKTERA